MATTKKSSKPALFVVVHRIRHNGEDYHKGEEIELTLTEAASLMQLGSIAVAVVDRAGADDQVVDLSIMSKAEIVQHAKDEHGVDLDVAAKKEDLIAAVTQAAAAGK
jgi:hypothetical protein